MIINLERKKTVKATSTMGSYDGAEIWEIFGTYFLSHLSTIVDKIDFGLYRGEGLLVLQNVNG